MMDAPDEQNGEMTDAPDANDIAQAHGIDVLRDHVDGATVVQLDKVRRERESWPEPDMRVVEDDRMPAPAIEDNALPAGWGPWIADEAEACGCPHDYTAAGLIGSASAWIGNARRCAAIADWNEPVHLWIALVGAPSAGKSPALRSMTAVSRALERDAEPAWQEDCARYERDKEAADAAEEKWRERVREAARGGAEVPHRPTGAAEVSAAPPRPRILTMNITTEELQRLLAENPRGLLSICDELSGWLGSFDQYRSAGRGADRSFYLECWNGSAYVSDKVKYHGTPVRIEHTSLAIIGGLVPDRLREILADADDGLAARLLYVWPDPAPIKPLKDRGDIVATLRRDVLLSAARRFRGLEMGADESGLPAPRALPLEADALRLFDELRRDAMERARRLSGLAAGWHGKNPGRALRLALVFEGLAWAKQGGPEPKVVSADSMARAGGYLDYATGMLDRVQGGLAIGRAETDAAIIGRHILATGATRINERELYRTSGFSWARDQKRLGEAFKVLSDIMHWVRRSTNTGTGRRPRGDWTVSPHLARIRK